MTSPTVGALGQAVKAAAKTVTDTKATTLDVATKAAGGTGQAERTTGKGA